MSMDQSKIWHQLQRGRTAQEGAGEEGGSSGTCVGRGIQAGRSLEQARENGMQREAGRTDSDEGGRAGIYGHWEKQRGSSRARLP